jgi:glycosyltransferase involved in cell wall biosynthesis
MKIAFISLMEGFPWGGSEELWSLAAMKALDKGQSVFFSVKLWDKQPERIKNLIENGAKPFFRHENERSVSLSSRIWTRIFPKKNSVEWSWIADHKIDHVCISMGGNYDIVYHERLANFLVENNVSYSLLQQFNFENEVLSRNIREKAKLLFENAKRVFFVSARNLMVSQRNLVTVLSNSFIINNPLRFSITAPLAYPSKEYGLQIAIVARLDAKYKGQDVALTALSTKIWKERSWVLNLYGSGPDEDYLKELTVYLGLSSRVFFHGNTTNIKQIWDINHILFLPSVAEGTPLALIEAMAFGRPAIVTDVGGNTELIDDNITGFVAESCSLACLNKVLEIAWSKEINWDSMGKSAFNKIVDTYKQNPAEVLYEFCVNL